MAESVGSRIYELFRRCGVTSQASLAQELGVERVTVNRWVKNMRKPQRRHIATMARLAGVSRAEMNRYLFFGEPLPGRATVDPTLIGLLLKLFAVWQTSSSFPQELNGYVREWAENPNGIDPEQITGDFWRILDSHRGDRE